MGAKVLVLAAVHGNEPEGSDLAFALIDEFSKGFGLGLQLTIVPQFNLEGLLRGTRVNANGIDLNRNLPSNDWSPEIKNPRYPPGPFANSESENQALVAWLDEHRPKMIFSLHSYHPMLNVNGDCRPEAETLHRLLGYPIVEDMGYPTPGCLGTYCGIERNMPTLTYEVERGLKTPEIIRLHKPALIEALKVTQERF
jgi:protein MpaA